MKVLTKAKISVLLAMVFFFLPFYIATFENNFLIGISFIIFILLIFFLRLLYFRNKSNEINYEEYRRVSLYYVFGIIFSIFAVLASIETIRDWKNINSTPLWGIIALIGLWTFGILIIYYTHKAVKEGEKYKKESYKKIY